MTANRSFSRLLWTAFALFLFSFSVAQAQFDNGGLVGTIRDSSGALVPNVTVTATNTATNSTQKATSNSEGDYEFPDLRVGPYNVTAEAASYAKAQATNIVISVGNRQRIDLTLRVGEANVTVEVSDVALQMETESSQRDQTITQYQSEALPLVSRNYSDLLGLVAGSRQAPTAATTSSISSLVRAGAYNVNGQRSMFNNFLLDGLDNNAYGESNQGFDNQIVAVPPDSVAQFQVVTNNESAEYGRSSGATINVATASGTNQLHFVLYEFLRNTDLNAAGFFKPTTGTVAFKKPTLNRNQYGFNVGGPIVHDKVFAFLDYEGFRQTLTPLSVLTLPTQNELNANLVVPVRNPITGMLYPAGSPIPSGAINPISLKVVNYFKQISGLPVSGAATTGQAASDYAVQVPFTDHADKGDLRFDWQQNPSTSWFLRISDRKENGVNFAPIPIPLDGQSNGHIRILDQQIALGGTKTFGSNKVLDARMGLSRTKAGKFNLSIGDTSFNFPGLPTDPVVAGGLPSIGLSGGFTSFGRQSTNPQWQNPAVINPKVNFTWVKGHHSMKFGYEYSHIWMAVEDNNPLYGAFTFSGGYSACPAGTTVPGVGACSAGNSNPALNSSAVADTYWADFLFGNTSSYSLANEYVAHLIQTNHAIYAQDDWKATSKLTLNIGLRWEYGSPYSELNNRVSNFDPATQTVLTTVPGAVASQFVTPVNQGGVYGKTLVNPQLGNFGPRLGFAYAFDPKTTVRGGFGMSYAHYTRAGSGDILAINAPQAQFTTVTQNAPTAGSHCNPLPAQIIAPGAITPSCYATIDQGFPSGLATVFNPATDNITYIPKDNKTSYVESYFLSMQRQLAKNTLIDIAYVGNHGVHLEGFLNANQKNPSNNFLRPFANWPTDITEALNEFKSRYDSLQIKYEQRFTGGLTLLNSFTWAHSLDNASASLEGNSPSPQDGNNIRADYSQSDYNLPLANITSLIYELPFGHGRRWMSNANGFEEAALGGWQISTINTMQSGTPYNITYGPGAANQVSPQISATYRGANEYRPNVITGVKQIVNTQVPTTGFIQYTNPAAFALPASGTGLNPFGNLSRNPLRNTPFYQTDLSLNKKFVTPIERLKVEFRTEFYNFFNHTNLYLPGSVGGTNGQTATTGGLITSTFEPRIVQFGLKILY